MTGKEDLVYIPIEKLHQLKQLCGNNFLPKDFKKKKTQLKKNAIPSVGLSVEPLPDELLIRYPLHIAITETSNSTLKQTELSSIISMENDYCGLVHLRYEWFSQRDDSVEVEIRHHFDTSTPRWRRYSSPPLRHQIKMPLTTAEKSKKYRERLKSNLEKYEISKEKSRARSAKHYKEKNKALDENKKMEMRLKWRQKYASKKESLSEVQRIEGQQRSNLDEADEVRDIGAEGPSARDESNEVHDMGAEVPSTTRRTEVMNDSELIQRKNRIEMKQVQRNIVNILRRNNAKLHEKVVTLERGFNSLRREMRELRKKYQELTEQRQEFAIEQEQNETADIAVLSQNNNTPFKRSDEFVEKHLAEVEIETPKKEAIKKKIFEYNVLTDSLKQTYKSCGNSEKKVLKGVVNNKFVKKYKITTNLTQNLGLKSNIRKTEENKKATKELKERLRVFYEREDVSRASAGKKECLTSKKCKKQKRYLSDKLRNLHKKYVTEVEAISFSTFKKHRPFYVVPPNLKNLETCACLKHANMQFIVNGLKSAGVFEYNDLNLIISSLVCDQTFKQCMYAECRACAEKLTEVDDKIEIDKTVKWYAWTLKDHVYNDKDTAKTSKRMVKTENTGSIKNLLDLFHAQLKAFKRHVFNVRHQYQQYKQCIENLQSNEAAIHIDFSENWVCKYNEEVQAMHFGASKKQITLHTGVLYIENENPCPFCSISEENSHGPEAIWAHLHPILEHIRSAHPNINSLHFHSDGPTSQYRQKKNFFLFCKIMYELGFNATWSFFEASHGKGAADGIGGSVKRTLDFKVSHGLDIPDAQRAFEVLQDAESSIKIFLIPPENIQPLDTSVVSKLLPIRDTMKIHQLITQSKFALKHRILSCFCKSLQGKCNCFNPALHIFDVNENSGTNYDTGNSDNLLLDEATGELILNENLDILDTHSRTESLDDISVLLDEKTGDNCLMKRKIYDMTDLQNKKRLKNNTLPKKGCDPNDSEEDDEFDKYSVHDTSDSIINDLDTDTDLADEVNDESTDVTDESTELNDENNYKNNDGVNLEINKGSYVLVKFFTDKRIKYYIGEVINLNDNSYTVTFLRNKGNGRFAWPMNEDTSVVYRTDIDQIIENPISERRGIKTFDIQHLCIKIE